MVVALIVIGNTTKVQLLLTRENYPKINFGQSNIYKFGLLILSLVNMTLEPKLCEQTWKAVLKFQQPIPQLISLCLSPDPRKRPPVSHLYESFE